MLLNWLEMRDEVQTLEGLDNRKGEGLEVNEIQHILDSEEVKQ